jgi:hypothetical protein
MKHRQAKKIVGDCLLVYEQLKPHAPPQLIAWITGYSVEQQRRAVVAMTRRVRRLYLRPRIRCLETLVKGED